MVEVTTYTCPKCKQVIYSRCKFDLHTCFCSSIECTGKILNNQFTEKDIVVGKTNLDTTSQELARDFYWNSGQYGVVGKS